MVGKYDSLRDSALHFLCTSEWSNESFGDCSTYGKYVWRISNTPEDVATTNTEFNSMFPEPLVELELTEELRSKLVGHFLVTELSSGQVLVYECDTELQLISIFNVIQDQYEEFTKTEEQE